MHLNSYQTLKVPTLFACFLTALCSHVLYLGLYVFTARGSIFNKVMPAGLGEQHKCVKQASIGKHERVLENEVDWRKHALCKR